MTNMKAIFIKQMQSLLKNPAMLIHAAIYIGLVLVMTFIATEPPEYDCDICYPAYVCAEHLDITAPLDVPRPSLAGLFAVMFVGLVLVGFSAALITEDKATQNLRFMAMSGVRPKQYLIGTAASLLLLTFAIILVFALVGGYLFGPDLPYFLAIGMLSALVSVLLGVTIGLSKYPIVASPISMILGIGPMLSTMNENLARYLRFTYTQQVNRAFSDISEGVVLDFTENFIIIGINGVVVLLAFLWVNRRGTLS